MLKLLSSVRITVVCLFLLFILTFWGTVAQVQQGLYVAQERFFSSFFFLAAGFLPFPGAQLVLWVLFINLVCMLISDMDRFRRPSSIGNLVIHLGLILYFVAAFFVYHLAHESYIHLAEGQKTDISTSYTDWELAYWHGHDTKATTVDSKSLRPWARVVSQDGAFTISARQYYPNWDGVKPKPLDKEREKNIAGGIFDLNTENQKQTLLLFGAAPAPVPAVIDGKKYYFILRRKVYPLPFTLTLEQFRVQFHPGTQIAKSYESFVTIATGSLTRQVRIYMNNPLRYKDYTIYQASYDTDSSGRTYSTLAVVKNSARVLPYIACFTVFFGLALHFFIQAFMSRIKP